MPSRGAAEWPSRAGTRRHPDTVAQVRACHQIADGCQSGAARAEATTRPDLVHSPPCHHRRRLGPSRRQAAAVLADPGGAQAHPVVRPGQDVPGGLGGVPAWSSTTTPCWKPTGPPPSSPSGGRPAGPTWSSWPPPSAATLAGPTTAGRGVDPRSPSRSSAGPPRGGQRSRPRRADTHQRGGDLGGRRRRGGRPASEGGDTPPWTTAPRPPPPDPPVGRQRGWSSHPSAGRARWVERRHGVVTATGGPGWCDGGPARPRPLRPRRRRLPVLHRTWLEHGRLTPLANPAPTADLAADRLAAVTLGRAVPGDLAGGLRQDRTLTEQGPPPRRRLRPAADRPHPRRLQHPGRPARCERLGELRPADPHPQLARPRHHRRHPGRSAAGAVARVARRSRRCRTTSSAS